MASESLRTLVANVPDWLKRLTELDGQIEQRQLDLANLPENQRKPSTKSIRNRGSTESLKPKDDGAAHPNPAPARDVTPPPATRNAPQPPSTPGSEPKSGSSLLRQTNEVVATAQRRARATVRKRQKTDSMMSGEVGVAPQYRTRRMIIVYYDSYVQSFFEELVKFVSAQRNLMRKAKMAAKVAEIKRRAELEMPDDDEDDDDEDDDNGELKPGNNLIAADPRPPSTKPNPDSPEELKLRTLHSRPGMRNPAVGMRVFRGTRPGAFGSGLGIFKEKGDIWDELDKGLEFVQGMCEHAAHQFLRDGDCVNEIEKIKLRLAETKEAAAKEMERQATEGTNGTAETEPVRARSYRPLTMRREAGASTPTKTPAQQPDMEAEDEGVQDMDDFKPVYKSTRLMNGPLR